MKSVVKFLIFMTFKTEATNNEGNLYLFYKGNSVNAPFMHHHHTFFGYLGQFL